MIVTLIQHELKAFWRSKNTGKNVLVRAVMAILILYLFLNVLAIGYFMDLFLEHLFPQEDLTVAFCGVILSYYLIDLLLRFQLQELPTLKVQPYLHLPIHRNALINYLSFASFKSVFNLWPWILFLPFIIKVILPDEGAATLFAFVLSIAGLTIFNNYLSLYIKRKGSLNGFIAIGFATFLVMIGLADQYWHLFSIQRLSYFFFSRLMDSPSQSLIPLFLGISIYYINFNYLKKNLYFEELDTQKSLVKRSAGIPFLSRFGHSGDLMANELKLIFRNKRSRSALIMNAFFLFYGLIFYTNKQYGDGWKLFCGLFMTGVFIINYGQFMFSWQAAHFDGILVSKTNLKDFLKAKFLLFTTFSTVAFILTLPYVYFGWRVLAINFVMYLWNIGINTTLVLYFANRNYKRIDLSRGASFNWEGVGGTQLLLSLPLMATPYVIYGPFALLHYPNAGLAVMALISLIFIFSRNWWTNKLYADFTLKKYAIAEGFRKK